MYRFLQLSELFGLFPLHTEGPFLNISPVSTSYSFFTISYLFIAVLVLFFRALNPFHLPIDAFYAVTDRILMFGSAPANALMFWVNRKSLKQIWFRSQINAPYNSDFTIFMMSGLLATLIAFDCYAPFFIFDPNRWNLEECIVYAFSHFYSWIVDNVFLVTYTVLTQPLVLLLAELSKPIIMNRKNLLRLKERHLEAMLVIKEGNRIFEIYGLSVIVNCYGQLISGYDYATVEVKEMGAPSLLIIEDFVYNFVRVGCVVWIAQKPAQLQIEIAHAVERLSIGIQNERYLSLLESFSLQLTQVSLEFNVFGLFDLNAGVVCSILASIITYTIIIIQLH